MSEINLSSFPHMIKEVEKSLEYARERDLKFEKQSILQTELLEKILEALTTIRDHQELIKEAMLYAPDGPGAEKACRSFHMSLASEDEDEKEHWMSRGR